MHPAARIICALRAHKFHTCRAQCIFCDVHAAAENDSNRFRRCGGETLRGFFDRLKKRTPRGESFFVIWCTASILASPFGRGVRAQRGRRGHAMTIPTVSYCFLIQILNQETRVLRTLELHSCAIPRLIQFLTHLRCYKNLFKIFNKN